LDSFRIKGFPKKPQVIPFFLFPDQFSPKSPQGHIGDREKASKRNVKTLAQLPPVVFFEGRLGRREKGPPGVIDKVQR
jgi:hypothetical protein